MIKEEIVQAIKKAYADLVESESSMIDFEVDFASNEQFGDYTCNIAMKVFQTEKSGIDGIKNHKRGSRASNPHELAIKFKEILSEDNNLKNMIDKVEVAGPGFINFWLKTDVLVSNLIQIEQEKEKYGTSTVGKDKLAIVEYSSPNIAKPFTVGHLRSTIIGDAIANLLEANGWKVMRDNHLGDWGTQFGKQIYAIKAWGDEEQIAKSENPVKELVKLYVRFHEEAEKDPSIEDEARLWFKKLEDGDAEARRLWQMCIDWSFVEFDRIYKTLGVTFSGEFNNGRGLGESFFETRMNSVITALEEKNLLKVGEDGAKLIFFDKDKYPPLMVIKKDGATLYATRDLATDKYRKEKYDPDLIINEVGSEQSLYFRQIFETERLLGWYKEGQRVHVGHGLIRFKEGKMSTRKGNVIWMDDVLGEARNHASELQKTRLIKDNRELHENNGNAIVNTKPGKAGEVEKNGDEVLETIDKVAIGALKYNDLKRDPKTDIVFDWDEILNMEGNSGPYLQYTVARTNSVLSKATNGVSKSKSNELNTEEISVLRTLNQFSEVVESAAKSYSPNLLCNYLYNLASKYNAFYARHRIFSTNSERTKSEALSSNKNRIIDSENEEFRLELTSATGQVLKNGLNLLGIQAPERM